MLAPLIDLCDHVAAPPLTVHVDEVSQTLCLRAVAPIGAGSHAPRSRTPLPPTNPSHRATSAPPILGAPLCISYGMLEAEQLLLGYGICEGASEVAETSAMDHGGEGGGSDGGACARLHVPLSISPCAELDADPRLLDTVPVVAITNHANPPRLGAMTPRY